jgi:hypothetical protein
MSLLHDNWQSEQSDRLQGCYQPLSKNVRNKIIFHKKFENFSNFYEEYPVSHPKVRVYDLPVNWSKPGDMTTDLDGQTVPLRGLIKCEVVPPRHPKHGIPVLPMRIGERLHFSLCRSCSHQYKKGGTKMPGYHCPHYEDNERGKF